MISVDRNGEQEGPGAPKAPPATPNLPAQPRARPKKGKNKRYELTSFCYTLCHTKLEFPCICFLVCLLFLLPIEEPGFCDKVLGSV